MSGGRDHVQFHGETENGTVPVEHGVRPGWVEDDPCDNIFRNCNEPDLGAFPAQRPMQRGVRTAQFLTLLRGQLCEAARFPCESASPARLGDKFVRVDDRGRECRGGGLRGSTDDCPVEDCGGEWGSARETESPPSTRRPDGTDSSRANEPMKSLMHCANTPRPWCAKFRSGSIRLTAIPPYAREPTLRARSRTTCRADTSRRQRHSRS